MRFIQLLLFVLLCTAQATVAQENQLEGFPIKEVMQNEPGTTSYFLKLDEQDSVHYQVFDHLGARIDSGYAQYLIYTDFDYGTYFVHFNGKIKRIVRARSPEEYIEVSDIVLITVLVCLLLITGLFLLFKRRIMRTNNQPNPAIESEPSLSNPTFQIDASAIDREKIERVALGKLNASDWKVIFEIAASPSISNKALAVKIALSVDGTRSSLKKMYRMFEIPTSRNMKLALALKLIELSKA